MSQRPVTHLQRFLAAILSAACLACVPAVEAKVVAPADLRADLAAYLPPSPATLPTTELGAPATDLPGSATAAEREAFLVEDADGNLYLASYAGQNPYNGADVYALSPLGLESAECAAFRVLDANPGTIPSGELGLAFSGSVRPSDLLAIAEQISGSREQALKLLESKYREYKVSNRREAEAFRAKWGIQRNQVGDIVLDVSAFVPVGRCVRAVEVAADVALVARAATIAERKLAPPVGKIIENAVTRRATIGAEQIGAGSIQEAEGVLNRFRVSSRPLLENEGILIDVRRGLQTTRTEKFVNVVQGSHGNLETKYLWTIDNRGLNIALDATPFPTPRGHIVHSNLSKEAAIGGEVWFTGVNEVTLNSGSGRFGFGSGATLEQWHAAVEYWRFRVCGGICDCFI